MALGFFLGFFLGIIGVVIVFVAKMGPNAKRGVGFGFGIQLAIGLLIQLLGRL